MGSHLQILIPIIFISSSFLSLITTIKHEKSAKYIFIVTVIICFFMSLFLFSAIYKSEEGIYKYYPGYAWSGEKVLKTGEPIGIEIKTDVFGSFLLFLVCILALITGIYSGSYISHAIPKEKGKYFYCLFSLMVAGMSGICLTGDLFNTFVFLEVASISSYALVAIQSTRDSFEASLKYTLVGAISSLFFLFGIALLYSATGSLNIGYISKQVSIIMTTDKIYIHKYKPLVFASLALFTTAFSIKAGLVPGHFWLADAHPAAPSSISAMLSGIFVKVTGIFLLIRFLIVIFAIHKGYYSNLIQYLLMAISVVSIIGGSVFAIAQENLKRMLAYSTISQVGYILFGFSLFTNKGLEGAILHIFNHAIIKALLFLCAGSIIYKTGVKNIRDLKGIGHKMPVTMGAFVIGSLAIIGFPPFNGFLSKWYLGSAAIETKYPYFIVVLLISGALSSVYYLRVISISFFPEPHSHLLDKKEIQPRSNFEESPISMLLPIVILSLASLFFGIYAKFNIDIVKKAVLILLKY